MDRLQPEISGPITGGRRGWPFGAAAFDLDAIGYVEQEWFFSGDASATHTLPGTDRVRSTDAGRPSPPRSVPFASRMLVRRPQDPAKFNGTVVVFWANVSLGFDIYTGECTRLYEGCAFVGVTAQRTAVEGYRDGPQHGLARLGPGALRQPVDPDRRRLVRHLHPGGPAGRPATARTGELDPLGGLEVRHVIAFGASQSAGRLATYINADPAAGAGVRRLPARRLLRQRNPLGYRRFCQSGRDATSIRSPISSALTASRRAAISCATSACRSSSSTPRANRSRTFRSGSPTPAATASGSSPGTRTGRCRARRRCAPAGSATSG